MAKREYELYKKEYEQYNRFCIVPRCTSTTQNCPYKLFISLPHEEPARSMWLQTIGREKDVFFSWITYYCCEDHFDLKTDLSNWNQFESDRQKNRKAMAILRPAVLPHKGLNKMPHIENQQYVGKNFPKDAGNSSYFHMDNSWCNNLVYKSATNGCAPQMNFSHPAMMNVNNSIYNGVNPSLTFNSPQGNEGYYDNREVFYVKDHNEYGGRKQSDEHSDVDRKNSIENESYFNFYSDVYQMVQPSSSTSQVKG